MLLPTAEAATPDGETPANEGVCNELQGGTPGLYGLCVAFCEAQDIASISDPITDEELAAIENGTPAGRILANYNKKKTETDIDMPCIKVEEPCPCFTADEAALIDGVSPTGGSVQLNCRTNGDPRSSIINEGVRSTGTITAGSFLDARPDSAEFNRGFCFYVNSQGSIRIVRTADTGISSPRDATMTPAQAASCVAIVDAACDAAGL
jgi:hypothetical protein